MPQFVSTATLRWATVSRASPMSRVTMAPVSTLKMYNILTLLDGCHRATLRICKQDI